MQTEDLQVLVPIVTASVVAILGAIRLSRCTRIRCCCIECERKVTEDARTRRPGDQADSDAQSPPAIERPPKESKDRHG